MKKLFTLCLLCVTLLFGFMPMLHAQTVWNGTADITWYDASQTSFDLSTPEQLAGLAQLVNNGTSFNGVTLNLTDDIWLNADNDSTNNWTPIGGGSPTSESPSTGNAFKGNFNGHGHAIYNLYCDKGSSFHAGLFCALENPCTIDSLVMVNPVLKSRGMMGCIAGFPRGSSSVYVRYCLVINARIVGENTSGSNNIGGICGATYPNSGNTYIQNCGVTGSITGHYPGGIAGNAERSNITNAYFAGTLYSYSTNYGGMTAHGGDRTNCYSYTQVLSSTSQSSASSDGTSVTQAEMQSANMITLLGSAFTMDFGINNGYPVMSFMAGVTPATAEICLGESVTLTAHGLDSYLWSTSATTESITVSPTTTTTYTVSGTYQGMSVTLSSVINVYPQAVISAVVMAGSDGQVHGTVTPDTAYVSCGSTDNITLTVTPDAGYRIESVTLNDVEIYGDVFGPGEQIITINPGGTLGEVKIYLSKCAIVTLPFTDDFESYSSSSVPECYTRISNYTYPYVYNYSSYAHSGSKIIYTYMYGTSYPYYLVLPKMFDMNTYPMESLQVTFWARTSNISNSVTVGVMSDPSDASTFTPLETFTFAATNTYYEYTCYFGAAAAGKPYIAFKYNCGSSYSFIYMDDVTVDVAPTCSPVTHLTVNNIYGTNASLHWDANVIGTTSEYLITVTDTAAQSTTTYTTTETSYLLPGLDEQTFYTVSVQPDCGGGDLGAAVTVSFTTPCNVSDCTPVSCIAPNTLSLVSTDASSAEIAWYNPNATQNCEIEYKGSSDADWTSMGTVSGTSYLLSGLDANTQYQVRVRANCGGNDYSAWSATVTFRTECEAIATLPYVENFDNDNYGSGEDAYVYCWDRYTNNPSSPVYHSTSSSAHSLSGMLRFDDGSGVVNIAIMPKVDESISLNELQVSFWVKNTSASSTAILELGVMTDKYDPTTFETLDTIHPQVVNQYNFIEYSLADYTGYGQYVAFRATNGNGGNNLRLDDVTLDYIPVCLHPVGLTASNITSETVDLTWSEEGNATNWIVEYGLEGFTPGDGMVINATDTAYTINGLNPNTTYDVYVYADCGNNFISTPINITFRTDCGPIVELPFSEDFEDASAIYSSASQQNYIVCWDRYASDPSHYVYIPSNTYAHSGTHFLDFHWTSGCYNIAIMPALDASFNVSDLMVSFYACRSGSSGTLEVGVMTDPAADSTFVPVDTIDLSSYNTYQYALQQVSFADYNGTGSYVAFRVSNAVNCGYYIDDVLLEERPDCMYPTNLHATNVSNEDVTLAWTEVGTATAWNILYGAAGFDPETEGTTVYANANPYTVTGLQNITEYDFYVQADCGGATSQWTGPITLTTGVYTMGTSGSDTLTTCGSIIYDNGGPDGNYSTSSNYTLVVYPATSGSGLQITGTCNLYVYSSYPAYSTYLYFYEGVGTSGPLLASYTGNNPSVAVASSGPITIRFSSSYYAASGFELTAVCSDCTPPSNVTVTDIDTNNATISWSGNASDYAVYLTGAVSGYYTTTDTFLVLSNLLPASSYNVQVRALCSGDSSMLSPVTHFNSGCAPVTITLDNPWFEDFEGYSGGGAQTLLCWDTPVTEEVSNGTAPFAYCGQSDAGHSGANTVEFKGTSNMAALPEFTNDIHNLRLTFWATTTNTSNYGTMEVGVLTDVNDPNSFLLLSNAGVPSSRNGVGNFMGPFDFSDVQATSGRIALRFTGYSGLSWNLDDITVSLIPECTAPSYNSVTVNNITDNSAEVSFVDDNTNHDAWVIYYGETGTTTDTWNSMSVSTATGNLLSGLNSNTNYSVFVVTVCNGVEGDEQTNTVTFTTTTTPTNLPYTTDFENATDNEQWVILNGTQTNKWYIGAPTNTTSEVNTTIGGTNGLYISNDNGATNAYTGTESRVYAYRDVLVPDGTTELVLSFDWKAQGGLYNYEFLRVYWLEPSANITPGNNPPGGLDASAQPGNYGPDASEHWLSQHNTWQHQEMIISADQFPGMGVGDKVYRLAFHWRNTYYSSQPPAAVDNIELRANTCATPTGLAVSNVGENDATVSWIGNADSYGVTITSASGTDYQTTTTNSLTLTGLNASTSYQVTVRAYCGTDSSMVSQSLSFTTSCGAISVATTPWTSDFEGTDEQILNCWVSASTGYRNGHTYPHIEPTPSIAHSGSSALEVAFGDIVTALPLFVEDLSQLQVSFWAYNNHWSSQNAVLELGYMTNPYDSATFVSLQSLTDQSYTQTTRTFSDLAGLNLPSTTRIAFRFIRPNGTSDLTSWYIDDIEVSMNNSSEICYQPTNLTVATSSITQTSATATWTAGGTETSWNVQYKTTTASNWQNATSSTTSYTMTGLTAGTQYEIRVQAVCDASTTSDWTGIVSFTTANEDTPTCPAPTDLHAELGESHTTVILTWQQEDNTANEWQINYRQTTENDWSAATANATSYTLTDLVPNVTYEFNVVAHCTNGLESDPSNSVTIQTDNVGIQSWLENSVKLYPNPATQVVNVACEMGNEATAIEVYNVYGQLLTALTADGSTMFTINVAGLANGMYYVRVTTNSGVVTKNFVKR